jgi:predicted nucleotidyltransferase
MGPSRPRSGDQAGSVRRVPCSPGARSEWERRHPTLEELARRAEGPLAAAGAERAIVFGSWARGAAVGFSDLDLAVVLDPALPRLERGALLGDLVAALPVRLDLLVFAPDESERGMRDAGASSTPLPGRGSPSMHEARAEAER